MASTVTELLRRRFMGGKKEEQTDLTGWTLGKGLTSGNYLSDDALLAVSPFYPTSVDLQYSVKAFNSYDSNHQCKFINTTKQTNGNRTHQETITTAPYSTTIYTGSNFFRFVIMLADADDCYIYDVTNSTYIWKGKNV